MSATAKTRVQSQTQSARPTHFASLVALVILLAFLVVIPRDSPQTYPVGAYGDGAGD